MATREVPVIYQQKRDVVKVDLSRHAAVIIRIRNHLKITDDFKLSGKRNEEEEYFDIKGDKDLKALGGAAAPVLLVETWPKTTVIFGHKIEQIGVDRSGFGAVRNSIKRRCHISEDVQLRVKNDSGDMIDINDDADLKDNKEFMHTIWVFLRLGKDNVAYRGKEVFSKRLSSLDANHQEKKMLLKLHDLLSVEDIYTLTCVMHLRMLRRCYNIIDFWSELKRFDVMRVGKYSAFKHTVRMEFQHEHECIIEVIEECEKEIKISLPNKWAKTIAEKETLKLIKRSHLHEMIDWLMAEVKKKGPQVHRGKAFVGRNFAIAIIGHEGGHLGFPNVELHIPEGALVGNRVIHCFRPVMPSDTSIDKSADKLIYFAPTINCGPDGTEFKKNITLRFKHCICDEDLNEADTLDVFTRRQKGENWEKDTGRFSIEGEWVEVTTNHFSDFTLGAIGDSSVLRRKVMLSTVIVTENENEERIRVMLVMTGNDTDQLEGFLSGLQTYTMQSSTFFNWLVRDISKRRVWTIRRDRSVGVEVKSGERYCVEDIERVFQEIPAAVIDKLPVRGHCEAFQMEAGGDNAHVVAICDFECVQREVTTTVPVIRDEHHPSQPVSLVIEAPVSDLDDFESVASLYGVQVLDVY